MAESRTVAAAKNGSDHNIDLADGRVLAPGEAAPDVDLAQPHNRAQVIAGVLLIDGDLPDPAPAGVDLGSPAPDVVKAIEATDLSTADLYALDAAERDGKARQTVLAAIQARLPYQPGQGVADLEETPS